MQHFPFLTTRLMTRLMAHDVFKALASANRRRVLDALFEEDGQTLTALSATADMSRQALSRHLRLLEEADLIVTEFRGREKLHFLNPVPVRAIAARWLARYAEHELDAIVALKSALEGEAMNKNDKERRFAYQTWIRSPIERVWEALTTPEFTAQYFHATHVDSDWKPGSPVLYRYAPGGDIAVDGEVLEVDPPRRLVISWHVRYNEAAIGEPPSRVTFALDEQDGQTRLRILHDAFPSDSVVYAGITEGWPWIVASLKSLLETGEALPAPAA